MSATTVVTDDTITSVTNDTPRGRFSWAAAFAGAIAATAVSFLLITLGTGVGLLMVSTPSLLNGQAPTFLTLGAIYFLAAQAFGFAVGGYIAGRLIGPQVETNREEEFRSGSHGLVAWALAVVAAGVLAVSGLTLGGAAIGGAAAASAAPAEGSKLADVSTAYWVDTLFRAPGGGSQASLAWRQYAQANNVGTDANQAPPADDESTPQAQPMTPVPDNGATAAPNAAQSPAPQDQTAQPQSTMDSSGSSTEAATPSDTMIAGSGDTTQPAQPSATRSVMGDKAETGRILDVGLANGGSLAQDDRNRIATLVSQDTGVTPAEATHRVNNVESRIRSAEVRAADIAKKVTRNVSLWLSLAMIFGAIVSIFAAIAARHEDDKITFGFSGRDV